MQTLCGIEKIAEYCYSLLLCVGAPGACRKGQNWPSLPEVLCGGARDSAIEPENEPLPRRRHAPPRGGRRGGRRRGPAVGPRRRRARPLREPAPVAREPAARGARGARGATGATAPPAVPAAPAPPPEPPRPVLTEAQQAAVDAQLCVACRGGDLPKVRDALKKGASTSCQNAHGWRPLHNAAANGRADAIRVLVAAGADIHARDSYGWTALHDAAARGHADCVRELLKAGADKHGKDKAELTPIHLAKQNSHHAAHDAMVNPNAGQKAAVNGPAPAKRKRPPKKKKGEAASPSGSASKKKKPAPFTAPPAPSPVAAPPASPFQMPAAAAGEHRGPYRVFSGVPASPRYCLFASMASMRQIVTSMAAGHIYIYGFLVCRYASSLGLAARQNTPAIDAAIYRPNGTSYQLQPSFHTYPTEPEPTARARRAGKEFY